MKYIFFISLIWFYGVASAAVSPEEAARLGGPELTPVGAERPGNADGTIPPWTGGITEVPPGYSPGQRHPDPFPGDEVLFTITAQNMEQHAEQLSEGQKGLFRTYPETWRMNVYKTRRSASFPDWVYEGIKANATAAQLVTEGKGGVTDARISSPFPIPGSGIEVIWNHNLKFSGVHIKSSTGTAAVTRRGRYRIVLAVQEFGIPYATRELTPFSREHPNIMLAFKSKTIAPPMLSGQGSLIIEPIDQTKHPRKSWIYSPALRRVLRVAYAAYDFPLERSDSLQTLDELGLFNGAPDRFEWKLLGKREMYIPYNAYRLDRADISFDELLQPGHFNPDEGRYERHRVWVVEGTRREGAKHIYSRRTFYVDEDSWKVSASDSYDSDGALWRTAEAHGMNYYEVPVHRDTLQVFYDLKELRYVATGLDNKRQAPMYYDDADPRDFSPNALSYYIR
jgi:hypothetical protein